jgi:hypothetical protein
MVEMEIEGAGGMLEPGNVSVPPGGSRLDTTLVDTVHSKEPCKKKKNSAKRDVQSPKRMARKGKKRGPGRIKLTLGGEKRVEKAEKRKMKRMINIEKGKAGIKMTKKTKAEQVLMEPPVSVLFVDNTMNGTLAKRLQEEEKRLGQARR